MHPKYSLELSIFMIGFMPFMSSSFSGYNIILLDSDICSSLSVEAYLVRFGMNIPDSITNWETQGVVVWLNLSFSCLSLIDSLNTWIY